MLSLFRSNALAEISNNQVVANDQKLINSSAKVIQPKAQEFKDELEKLSAKDLSLKLSDEKEVEKVLADEDLVLLVLRKAAGTKERKQSVSPTQENHGRFYSPVPFSEEVLKENHGLYLVDICKNSKKFEQFLFDNEASLKEKGVIDDQVISDLRTAAARRKVQFVPLRRFYD